MSSGLRILYIDDDPALARLAKRDLERRGHSIEIAKDADAGIARVSLGGIDVVALDHYMPGQNGFATLEAIRGIPAAPRWST